MIDKLALAIRDPARAASAVRRRVMAPFVVPTYSAAKGNRSESDTGPYVDAIRKALASQRAFDRFKRDPDYQTILEHASEAQGQAYLDIVRARGDGLLDRALTHLLVADGVGDPVRFSYQGIGQPLSPTTLRYLKVTSDIARLFGTDLGRVAEIGCGYGGQCLANDTLLDVDRAFLFDLPIVNALINRYLEHFVMRGSFETRTINTTQPESYDLVISNYAFSELPKPLQLRYVEKVLARSARGYLTMNSGKGGTFDTSFEKMSFAELEAALPPLTVFEEQPLSSPYNYTIVWGQHPGAKLSV